MSEPQLHLQAGTSTNYICPEGRGTLSSIFPPPWIYHPSYVHHHAHPNIPPEAALVPIDILTNSPRLIRTAPGVFVYRVPDSRRASVRHADEDAEAEIRSATEVDEDDDEDRKIEIRAMVGRRRQVIGILVLQLGIMIHSFVIGLTLSIASGADFASLTTAIIFHHSLKVSLSGSE
ncbi:hypothetical protein BDQ17DRAFT_379170 [Cyathus striatus]|nr:hypothetical protein BDQ17DRAFT_379170 [Cyathus striatus]